MHWALIIAIWALVAGIVSFTLFGIDKRKAKKQQWRIPEATLLLSCALGGSIGGLLAMYIFHHKTRKPKFKFGVPAILLAQIALIVLIALVVH